MIDLARLQPRLDLESNFGVVSKFPNTPERDYAQGPLDHVLDPLKIGS